jgi:FlaA1/EpsC-like NDP-sugar epimerase
MLVKHRSWFMVILQLILVFVSLTCAWLLRFEFKLPYFSLLLWSFPILALFRAAALAHFNLSHGYWRHTGLSDLEDVARAVSVGSVAFFIAERWILGVTAFPISIYILEAVFTGLLLSGARICVRLATQDREARRSASSKRKVIVVGAGCASAALLSELPRHGYVAVGLVDDDPAKARARLHGVPVIGTVDRLPELAERKAIHEILIAIPSATRKQMCRITEFCQQAHVRFRTIPALVDLIENRDSVEQLRKVSVEDLLGREPVRLDRTVVHEQVKGRVVLVTGAAGSIGSELCAQLLLCQPAKLICLDQDESGLFFLEQRLQQHSSGASAEYIVADVTDQRRTRSVLQSSGVEIIFHAAAYKHVPMMERNVHEAVRNNVMGIMALLESAEECGCKSFLLISSDKAVNPTNVMGCTKRICELILASRPYANMRCVSVRFGNVLGSQGSVVPIFEEQIRKQHRVTLTHPEITRFFMTIPEAVSLVLQAFAVGKQGEILVLDMGDPVRIVDLARTMIRLLVRAGDEVQIIYTGLREGEKLYEELFYANESPLPTKCKKILRASRMPGNWSLLHSRLTELKSMVYAGSDDAIRVKLKQIVPEYQYAVPPALPVVPVTELPAWQDAPVGLPVWQGAAGLFDTARTTIRSGRNL